MLKSVPLHTASLSSFLKAIRLFADSIYKGLKMDTLIQIIKEPILWLFSAVIVFSYIAENKLKANNKK
jgi:hypothetical protein